MTRSHRCSERPQETATCPPNGECRKMPITDDYTIPVLDHGFVRLVDSMGDDLSIVRAARVSYNAAWRTGEDHASDKRLINYLWKNSHTSPFESVTMTFHVRAPIFVLRQWHRHRTWSYNEVSARYTELPEQFYVPSPELVGTQSTHNKQTRDMGLSNYDATLVMKNICEESFGVYKKLLSEGIPRELARIVLPMSTYSEMFATVNLLNLFKFLTLRDHPHAQYEINVYAKAMIELARTVVPVAVEAWEREKARG